jgi:hypothetical protein
MIRVMRNMLLAVAALLALQAVPAHAERDPWSGAPIKPDKKRMTTSPITDRFYVRGTFFNPAVTTSLRIDTQSPGGGLPGTTGTTVSGERDLGLDSRIPQGRIEIMFRLRERNRLRVDYFETNRRGNNVISRQILFGDEVFSAADRVTSSIDWRQFALTYTYSVLRTDRLELGFGLGVHFLQAEARGAVEAKGLRQEVSGSGAFPTIPVDFTWRISRRFAVVARAQYFKASVNNFSGALGEYHGDFQYRWKPNFTVGAGYTTMRAGLDVQDAHFPGSFRLDVRGPEAFFKVSF